MARSADWCLGSLHKHFAFFSPKPSRSLPEMTMVLCMGNQTTAWTDYPLQKPCILLQNWRVCHFWRLQQIPRTWHAANCRILSLFHLWALFPLPFCLFSDISKVSIVHQALQEVCGDFSFRFLGVQIQLLSHKIYDANSQFYTRQFPFTLVLKFSGFSFPVQINLTNLYFLSP